MATMPLWLCRLAPCLTYRTVQMPLLDPFHKVRYFVGTGFVIEGKQMEAEFGKLDFKKAKLVERRFFDIGAGVPNEIKLADTSLESRPDN